MFGRRRAIAVALSFERALILCHYPLPEVLHGIGPTHIDRFIHVYRPLARLTQMTKGGGVLSTLSTPPKSAPAVDLLGLLVISQVISPPCLRKYQATLEDTRGI